MQKSSKLELFYTLPDSQDPRILEICKKVKSVEGPATGRFIRSCVSLLSEADRQGLLKMWRSLIQRLSTRTTAETNTLTYYIVTNKKDNVADSGIIPCGIGDHDLGYIIRHATLPKIKKDPKIVTVRSTKNLNNDTLIKDLNELPFELIRASDDNPLVKLEIFVS